MTRTAKYAIVINGMESDRFEQVIFISDEKTAANTEELLCAARTLSKTVPYKKTGSDIAVLALGFLAGCTVTVFVWLLCLMM